MRTVDIIVTDLFSPAAVAAVGLADLYAQLQLRLGLGLGTGAITLSSQHTRRGRSRPATGRVPNRHSARLLFGDF